MNLHLAGMAKLPKQGKSLFGKDGAFAPMLKNVIEKALSAEIEAHLDSNEREQGNKRNGKGKKRLKVVLGVLI